MNIDDPPRIVLDPRRIWRERVRFLVQSKPTHALTLAWNDTCSLQRVRTVLRHVHAHIDRRVLGRQFNKAASSRRTWFAAFIENLKSNTHAHLIVRVDKEQWTSFEGLFPGGRGPFWTKWAPRGTYDLKQTFDPLGWAAYATKCVTTNDEWIDSTEFLPLQISA